MKYQANPVVVDAFRIISVEPMPNADPPLSRQVHTEDGNLRFATTGMVARYVPKVGDYWVIQSDGYEYLNPKDVFEHKYRQVSTLTEVEMTGQNTGAINSIKPQQT